MAIKHTLCKNYNVSLDDVYSVLRNSDFCQCMEAEFIEEAILSDGVEFRFRRKTDMHRYGRNYFIKTTRTGEDEVCVAVTVQSRKVTVLWDMGWEKEARKAFGFIDMLLRR